EQGQEMLNERGRELYIEMWRRQDLIRFGKFTEAWEFKPATEDFRNLFPIPSIALNSNPNLVQNEGY
ncbi:MAG TPA: RagB/SusD family nutrient uptake outer membrane protein, partial [Gillisia sp.]|nr:RagB/SusD family nutrient uptake outer membrane protein [Gillisia sp.]